MSRRGTDRPLVSVVVPVYNAASYVEQAVRSAVDLPVRTEVLLVEDGSTDESLSICRGLAEANEAVRLLQHEDAGNHGASASRNLGIRAAAGDYVSFLDADDYYLPNRFDADVPMLERDAGLDGAYGAVGMQYDPGAPPSPAGHCEVVTVAEPIEPEELFEALVLGGRGRFRMEGITVRRDAFDSTGLFDERLPLSQDLEMWLRMAAVCRLAPGSIVEPIAVYRRHPGNRARLDNPLWRDAECEVYSRTLQWARRVRLEHRKVRLLRDALILSVRHRRLYELGRVAAFLRVWRRTLRYQLRDPWLLPTILGRGFRKLWGRG
jgi:glycosyltransferase involved in cell wall biosynthesis